MILNILLTLVGIAVTLIPLYYLLRYIFSEMAKQDLLFTFRTEGEIKAIMKGEKCVRYVMAVENHIIDPDDFDVFKASRDNPRPYAKYLALQAELRRKTDNTFVERKLKDKKDWKNENEPEFDSNFEKKLRKANHETWFEETFGIVWIGFPPFKVFTYKFRWIKYGQQEAGEDGRPSANIIMTPRDELVDSLYFHYTQYGVVIDNAKTGKGSLIETRPSEETEKAVPGKPAETKKESGGAKKSDEVIREQVELVYNLVIETETANPQKTLFRTAGLSSAGEWLSAICNTIRDVVREWTTTQSWDSIIDEQEQVREFLQDLCIQVNAGIPILKRGEKDAKVVSAEKDYGQRILKISLISVALKDPELQKSLDAIFNAKRKVRKAEQDKLATIQTALGKRAEAAADGLGKAEGYAAIIKAGGRDIAVAEAIGKGGIKVLNVGGRGGAGMITSLPESILEEVETAPNEKVPPVAETP